MWLKSVVLMILASVVMIGCGSGNETRQGTVFPPDQSSRVTISEGLWGQVWFYQGNFMPGAPSGTVTAVKRKVLIYEQTSQSQVVRLPFNPPFFTAISTQKITEVESDARGFFQITLPPGKYSIFVEEDGMLYANGETDNAIYPATVSPGTVNKVQFNITHKAAY
jgi:hypothetical protein